MRYTLMIDSTAALPQSFLDRDYVKVAPIAVKCGERIIEDPVTQDGRLKIFQQGFVDAKEGISSIPPSKEDLHDLIMEEVVPNFDVVVFLSLTQHASPVHSTFLEVANSIQSEARAKRNELGIDAPFRIAANHTGTLAAGQGLITLFADHLLARGTPIAEYTEKIDKFRKLVNNFIVVKDFMHAREVAVQRGVGSVSFPMALVGQAVGMAPITNFKNDGNEVLKVNLGFEGAVKKVFGQIQRSIESGLLLKFVNICAAGDPKEVTTYPGFDEMYEVAKANQVKVLLSVMPLSAAVNLGAKAISAAIAPRDQSISL